MADTLLRDNGETAKLKGKIEALNVSTDVFLGFLTDYLPEDKHHNLIVTLKESFTQKEKSLPDDPLLKESFDDKTQSVLRKVMNP